MDLGDPKLPPRFWAKIVTQPNENPRLNDCWLWDAAIDGDGYPRFNIYVERVKRSARAHRVSYAAVKGLKVYGSRLRGVDIHHLCRMRACVRPDHLRAQDHAAHGFHHGKNRNNQEFCTRSRYCMCWNCCDERETG